MVYGLEVQKMESVLKVLDFPAVASAEVHLFAAEDLIRFFHFTVDLRDGYQLVRAAIAALIYYGGLKVSQIKALTYGGTEPMQCPLIVT